MKYIFVILCYARSQPYIPFKSMEPTTGMLQFQGVGKQTNRHNFKIFFFLFTSSESSCDRNQKSLIKHIKKYTTTSLNLKLIPSEGEKL
jgi:hypothetical protein